MFEFTSDQRKIAFAVAFARYKLTLRKPGYDMYFCVLRFVIQIWILSLACSKLKQKFSFFSMMYFQANFKIQEIDFGLV